jgi:hypothetical protein
MGNIDAHDIFDTKLDVIENIMDNKLVLSNEQSFLLFNKYLQIGTEVNSQLEKDKKSSQIVTFVLEKHLLYDSHTIGYYKGDIYAFRLDKGSRRRPFILFEYNNINYNSSRQIIETFIQCSKLDKKMMEYEEEESEPLLTSLKIITISPFECRCSDCLTCIYVVKVLQ